MACLDGSPSGFGAFQRPWKRISRCGLWPLKCGGHRRPATFLWTAPKDRGERAEGPLWRRGPRRPTGPVVRSGGRCEPRGPTGPDCPSEAGASRFPGETILVRERSEEGDEVDAAGAFDEECEAGEADEDGAYPLHPHEAVPEPSKTGEGDGEEGDLAELDAEVEAEEGAGEFFGLVLGQDAGEGAGEAEAVDEAEGADEDEAAFAEFLDAEVLDADPGDAGGDKDFDGLGGEGHPAKGGGGEGDGVGEGEGERLAEQGLPLRDEEEEAEDEEDVIEAFGEDVLEADLDPIANGEGLGLEGFFGGSAFGDGHLLAAHDRLGPGIGAGAGEDDKDDAEGFLPTDVELLGSGGKLGVDGDLEHGEFLRFAFGEEGGGGLVEDRDVHGPRDLGAIGEGGEATAPVGDGFGFDLRPAIGALCAEPGEVLGFLVLIAAEFLEHVGGVGLGEAFDFVALEIERHGDFGNLVGVEETGY